MTTFWELNKSRNGDGVVGTVVAVEAKAVYQMNIHPKAACRLRLLTRLNGTSHCDH